MTKPKVYFKDNAACLIFNNGSPSIEDLKQGNYYLILEQNNNIISKEFIKL